MNMPENPGTDMPTDPEIASHKSTSRRGFIGITASAIAGVMIAPGVRLIEKSV